MSSSQVPLWVPLVVGVIGMAGVLGAQIIAGWREERRWQRETQQEELRWRRERERERENRSYDGRALAYADVIGAIEAFDWVLYQARQVVKEGRTLDLDLAAELRRVTSQARNALGGVNVYAPESIRAMLRESMLRRSTLSIALLEGKHGPEQTRQWRDGQLEYKIMRTAMRENLGLDAEAAEADVRPDPFGFPGAGSP